MTVLYFIMAFLVNIPTATAVLPEPLSTSNSACPSCGSVADITPTCPSSSFTIAIADYFAGFKNTTAYSFCVSNCNDTCCISDPATDCHSVLDKNIGLINLCNGKQTDCSYGPQGSSAFTTTECSTGPWESTNYAFSTFYCIESSRISAIGGNSIQASGFNTTLYVWNDNFGLSDVPAFSTSQQEYVFSVQTSESTAFLKFHTIQREISASVNMTVRNASGHTLVTWTGPEQMYTLETINTTSDYVSVTVQLPTDESANNFFWWIGFEATSPTTITINYPPVTDTGGESSDGLSAGAIVGIVIGSLIGLALLVVVSYCLFYPNSLFRRACRDRADKSRASPQPGTSSSTQHDTVVSPVVVVTTAEDALATTTTTTIGDLRDRADESRASPQPGTSSSTQHDTVVSPVVVVKTTEDALATTTTTTTTPTSTTATNTTMASVFKPKDTLQAPVHWFARPITARLDLPTEWTQETIGKFITELPNSDASDKRHMPQDETSPTSPVTPSPDTTADEGLSARGAENKENPIQTSPDSGYNDTRRDEQREHSDHLRNNVLTMSQVADEDVAVNHVQAAEKNTKTSSDTGKVKTKPSSKTDLDETNKERHTGAKTHGEKLTDKQKGVSCTETLTNRGKAESPKLGTSSEQMHSTKATHEMINEALDEAEDPELKFDQLGDISKEDSVENRVEAHAEEHSCEAPVETEEAERDNGRESGGVSDTRNLRRTIHFRVSSSPRPAMSPLRKLSRMKSPNRVTPVSKSNINVE